MGIVAVARFAAATWTFDPGDDHVRAQPHKLCRKLRQPLEPAVCVPALEHEIALLDVAEIAQTLGKRAQQRLDGLGRRAQKNPDPGDFPACCASAASGAAPSTSSASTVSRLSIRLPLVVANQYRQ